MSFSMVHVSDPHFGDVADLHKIAAVENLVPDLEPDVTVISGDLTLRARHGEFQAARLFVRELERTGPVFVIPGNHDVQWWWRPFIPFASQAKYTKFRRHFGPVLTPTMDLTEAIIAGAQTAHGIAWGSLTPRLRDLAVKGHLRKEEARRVKSLFAKAGSEQTRVLVLHHNMLRGQLSERMGLARWRRAQRHIVDTGADVVLCGHDHQEKVDMLEGVVVSCAGTISQSSRGGRRSAFHRLCFEDDSIQVEIYVWEPKQRLFKRSDIAVFARRRTVNEPQVAAGAV